MNYAFPCVRFQLLPYIFGESSGALTCALMPGAEMVYLPSSPGWWAASAAVAAATAGTTTDLSVMVMMMMTLYVIPCLVSSMG